MSEDESNIIKKQIGAYPFGLLNLGNTVCVVFELNGTKRNRQICQTLLRCSALIALAPTRENWCYWVKDATIPSVEPPRGSLVLEMTLTQSKKEMYCFSEYLN